MSSPKGVGLATTAALAITSAANRMITAMTSIATLTGTRALSRVWGCSGNFGKGMSTVDLTILRACGSVTGISGMMPCVVVFRNLLFIEGYTGLEGLSTTEGSIGTGSPAKAQAPVSKSYVVFLPGARSDLKATAATVSYALPYPLVAFCTTPTAMLEMGVDASWMPTITSTRRRPSRVSAEASVELLSALTSAPFITDRACIPIERQRKFMRPTTGSVGTSIGRRIRARRQLLGPSSSPPSAVRATSRVS